MEELLGIGRDPHDFTVLNVAIRALVIFFFAVFLVRIADKRFLSKKSAFDAVLGFLLASVLSRAVNGSAPLVPTLVAGLVIVLLHRCMGHLARHWHFIGRFIKGNSDLLIEDGRLNEKAMSCNAFSQHDLEEDLRLHGVESIDDVKTAYVERSGEVSIIKKA